MFRIMRDENNNNLHFFYEKYEENTQSIFRKVTQVYYNSLEPVSETPVFKKEKEVLILKKEELNRFFKKGVPLTYHSSPGDTPALGLVFTSSSDYIDNVSQVSVTDGFYLDYVVLSREGRLSVNSSYFEIRNVAPYNFNSAVWEDIVSNSTHVVSVKNRTITPRRNFDMSLIKDLFEYIPIRVNEEGLSRLTSFEDKIDKYHLCPMSPEELFRQLFQGNREEVLKTFSETTLPTEDTDEGAVDLLYPDGYYLKNSNVFQVVTLKDGNKVIYVPTRDYSNSFLRPRYVFAGEGFVFTADGSTAVAYALSQMYRNSENPLILKSDGGYEIIYRQRDSQYTIYSYDEDLLFKGRKRRFLEDLESEARDWKFVPIEDKNNMLLRILAVKDSSFNRMVLVKDEEVVIIGDYVYERPNDGRLALYTVDASYLEEGGLEKEVSLDFQDVKNYLANGYELKKIHTFSGLTNIFPALNRLTAVF